MRKSGLIKILIARVDSAKESDRSHACVRRISTLRDLRAVPREIKTGELCPVLRFLFRARPSRRSPSDPLASTGPQSIKEDRTVVFFTLCEWIHDDRRLLALRELLLRMRSPLTWRSASL